MGLDDRRAGRPVVCLLSRVGGAVCAFRLGNILETMRPLPLASAPANEPAWLGVAQIRGERVPVIDAAGLVGRSGGSFTRFVTLRDGPTTWALAVDAVIGIVEIDAAEHDLLPPFLTGQERAEALRRRYPELHTALSTTRVVGES